MHNVLIGGAILAAYFLGPFTVFTFQEDRGYWHTLAKQTVIYFVIFVLILVVYGLVKTVQWFAGVGH